MSRRFSKTTRRERVHLSGGVLREAFEKPDAVPNNILKRPLKLSPMKRIKK